MTRNDILIVNNKQLLSTFKRSSKTELFDSAYSKHEQPSLGQ